MSGKHKTYQLLRGTIIKNLYLSPLTINKSLNGEILLAGEWCLNQETVEFLKQAGVEYEVNKTRTLSKEDYTEEANLCMELYDKYIGILSEELNKLHGVTYSVRYWSTLLHGFLYSITACVIDHYLTLKNITEAHTNVLADIIDYKGDWGIYHGYPGGSSRILHLLIFSIIVKETDIVPGKIIDANLVKVALEKYGDGKKDNPSEKNRISFFGKIKKKIRFFLFPFKQVFIGELPLWIFKYAHSNILALGDQYLPPTLIKRLLSKAGGTPCYISAKKWDTRKFNQQDQKSRDNICMPKAESKIELALQECLRRLLPTAYLENYRFLKNKTNKIVPKRKLVILNSQHCNGGDVLNFYIARSVEKYNSHHLMICHGGCYGVMDISIQEKVWGKISDTYAMWSNEKKYSSNCMSKKMPSLRFHKWQGFCENKETGNDILLFLTGHYPNRYAYNSIYPYTIDDTYNQWQIRFLSAISEENLDSLVIRDFHQSERISGDGVMNWARAHNVRTNARSPLSEALGKAKISVQTVPQTTYLETIIADHPTICFWNPEANLIRSDLQEYFDRLIDVGVLHLTPESAARHLNEVANDPLKWWQSLPVRAALQEFRHNVCYTSPDAIDEWAEFISEKYQSS